MVMDDYLASTDCIDWKHPVVCAEAARLVAGLTSVRATIERCFVFVRDEIEHSGDVQCQRVTWRASDVLEYRTGYCYAKSHLLAALLRANGVHAGLCYQRLRLNDEGTEFCLHGLNAVRLANGRWFRLDPRGNKAGLNAAYSPPNESLPFSPQHEGESDFPSVYSEPLPVVLSALQAHRTGEQLEAHLPDAEPELTPDYPTWERVPVDKC